MKKAKINIECELDNYRIPKRIIWKATDNNNKIESCKAMFLYFWDHKDKNAFNINLWTKDMTINEMKIFFYQILITMANTFEKATNEKNITEDLKDYCKHFIDKMKINS